MEQQAITGTVSFVNHERNRVTIDYESNGKKKSITTPVEYPADQKSARKQRSLMVGDTVSFIPALTPRGDRQIATQIRFLYNTPLEVLVNKAKLDNRFTGYLKETPDGYYVKELNSYIFFPVMLSPWHKKPRESDLNNPVGFTLEDMERPERMKAKLLKNEYIPEFHTAVKCQRSKTPVEAVVYKTGPHGIYLNLFGEAIRCKLPVSEKTASLKVNDTVKVIITHIGDNRIIVEPLP